MAFRPFGSGRPEHAGGMEIGITSISQQTNRIMKASKQPKAESARFREFFIDQIKDIYWAEKHLSAALKKMQKAATSPRLAEAFANHIVESEGQLRRLDKVFELLGKKPQAKKCDAMEGLISEAESVIEDTPE